MSVMFHAKHTPWHREALSPAERPALGPEHLTNVRVLNVLLAWCAAVGLLRVMLDIYGMTVFTSGQSNSLDTFPADGKHFTTVDLTLTGFWRLVVFATGVATITWLYQAYGSREADPALLPHERWWTIGGWFIPLANLVRPFQLIRDLYRASTGVESETASPERPDPEARCPNLIRWWWALLLLGNLFAGIAVLIVRVDPSLSRVQVSLGLTVLSQISFIAAAVLFMTVVRSITSNLWHRASAVPPDLPVRPASHQREPVSPPAVPAQNARCSSMPAAKARRSSVR